MKILLNWRYYVMFALFCVGTFFLMASGGEPIEEMSITKEMFLHILFFGISMLSFYILKLAVNYWEKRDLIPEFTHQLDEDEEEWE